MPVTDLLFPKKQVLIVNTNDPTDFVFLDASVDEQHTGESEVTDYPVEEGSDISDNSRPKPRTFTIHGFVTSAPLNGLDPYKLNPFTKDLRGKRAWEKLDKWRRTGTRLKVRTTFYSYVDVVLTSVSVPRNVRNTDGAELILAFRQVFTTSTKTVSKPQRTQKQPRAGVGKKPNTGPTTPVDEAGKTFLLDTSDFFGTLIP